MSIQYCHYCNRYIDTDNEAEHFDCSVKWRSKKKFNCKINKGEHEFLAPIITYKPTVRYIYKTDENMILDSDKLHPEYKFIKAEVSLATESRCKHCGKKVKNFFSQKIN